MSSMPPSAPGVVLLHDIRDAEAVSTVEEALRPLGLEPHGLKDISSVSLNFDEPPGRVLKIVAVDGPRPVLGLVLGAAGPTPALVEAARIAYRNVPVYAILVPGWDGRAAEKLPVPFKPSEIFDLRDDGADAPAATALVEAVLRVLAPVSPDVAQSAAPEPAPRPPASKSAAAKGPAKTAAPARRSRSGRITATEARDIFERLSTSSAEALGRAAALMTLNGDTAIHMEYLLVGLEMKSDGPTERLLAGLDPPVDAPALHRILRGVTEKRLPDPDTYAVPALSSLPPLSAHVLEAVRASRLIADETGAAQIQSRHLLYGALGVTGCGPVAQLLERGADRDRIDLDAPPSPAPDIDAEIPPALAGYRSDDPDGDDLLNLRTEVNALATVLAARDVKPPLALGLFGDWGTGKTFFMNKLRRRIDEIAAAEKSWDRENPVYWREVVQLTFNAWHYSDQDLWANLTSSIFEGLDDELTRRALPATAQDARGVERTKLLTQRALAQEQLADAERDKADASATLDRTRRDLAEVDERTDELATAVRPEAVLAGGVAVLTRQPELRAAVNAVLGRLDTEAGKQGVDGPALRAELVRAGEDGSQLLAVGRAFLHRRNWRIWLPLAAGGLGAIVVASALVGTTLGAGAPFAALITFAGGAAMALRPVLHVAQVVTRVFHDARTEATRLVDEKRTKERQALVEKEVTDAEAVDAAALKAVLAKEAIAGVDARLDELWPERRMADFIKGRRLSTDYRSRLGVIAQARDDFQQLTEFLARQAETDPEKRAPTVVDGRPLLPQIDRIVLYIDDLDRCGEKEVVDVLQAVHLLLAFPLFVVVVAVDPRWLRHSLRYRSRAFDRARPDGSMDDDEVSEWEATPLNYLEKIFQIPFALRPMDRTGFGAIVKELLADAGPRDVAGSAVVAGGSGELVPDRDDRDAARDGPRTDAETPTTERGPVTPVAAAVDAPETLGVQLESAPAPVPKQPPALLIGRAEREFMESMHPLIGTPRATKRFVNVYRLLKASRDPEAQLGFEEPAIHRPVLLLLAILTGYPAEATDLLRELIEREGDRDGLWWPFVRRVGAAAGRRSDDGLGPRAAEQWSQLLARLGPIEAEMAGRPRRRQFAVWAHEVARYSFESSRVLLIEPAARPRQTVASAARPAGGAARVARPTNAT